MRQKLDVMKKLPSLVVMKKPISVYLTQDLNGRG